jgi:hypothetical protein
MLPAPLAWRVAGSQKKLPCDVELPVVPVMPAAIARWG